VNGRALIVDDNRVNRMVLRRGLAEQGVDAIEAKDGSSTSERGSRRATPR
jgi:CheY-like chemotaxis protein